MFITAGEAWNGDITIFVHLEVRPDVEVEADQFLRGQRMPVPEGTAQVVLNVVVVTSLGQSHARDVLKDMEQGAVMEQEHHTKEARGGRSGKQRPRGHRLEPVPH